MPRRRVKIARQLTEYKTKASPYFATGFLYVFGLIAFLSIWIAQQSIKIINGTETKSKKRETTRRMNGVYHQILGKLTVDLNPFWKRYVEFDTPPKELPAVVIYMSNHTSFADTFFYAGAFAHPHTTAVGKSSLRDVPVLGTITRNNGMLPVFFKRTETGKWTTDKKEVQRMMKRAEERLSDGMSIAIFPEGNISHTGELLPFKTGFFRIALKTYTPIIPSSTWGNQKGLPMAGKSAKGTSQSNYWAFGTRSYIHCASPESPINASSFEDPRVMELVDAITADDASGIVEWDFSEEGWPTLGEKLSNSESKACEELFTLLVDHLVERVFNIIDMNLTTLKEREEEEVAKEEQWVDEMDQMFEKGLEVFG